MSKKIYLVDGTAYIYRAFHAVRNLSTSKGFPTSAIFGFTRMLIKLIADCKPEYVAMVFDAKGPTFRHEMYKEYKATRPPMPDDLVVQIPLIKRITSEFCLPCFEIVGFEADDIIGTLSVQAQKHGFKVVMVTGDKDFIQLITDDCTTWDPMKEIKLDKKAIYEKFGIEPNQYVDVLALWGDSSDNVPGVKGIGEKTALSLIQGYGSLDNIYKQVNNLTNNRQKENLIQSKSEAYLSQKLVKIDCAAPVEFDPEKLKFKEPNRNELAKLFQELEFRQLQQEFPLQKEQHEKNYKTILSLSELDTLIEQLIKAGTFSIDTETTSEDPMRAQLVGVSLAYKEHEAYYIPCEHHYLGAVKQLALKDVIKRLKPILENPELHKIGQNIKYDWIVLKRHGINLTGVTFDTMVASYVLNPSQQSHSLDRIATDFLGMQTISYKSLTGTGKQAIKFTEVPIEQATSYSCEDADVTLIMFKIFKEKLQEANLLSLFETMEMPLVPVLTDMEMIGVKVDETVLKNLSTVFESELITLETQIYESAGERFNIQSPKQLESILFDKLQLPTRKKTKKKTGFSTDSDVLTSLAQTHTLPALILKYRETAKLKSTYADALLELIHPETGRIHTSYNQSVTATGRLSSSDPNLQNIPIRTEEGRKIRQAFIPKQGSVLLSADYSQIELRILAHLADDPILIDAFSKEEDIHTRTACEIFGLTPEMVTSELRRQAKAINFGIIYGMSAFRLSNELGISNKMAQTYIDHYFDRYGKIRRFIDETVAQAAKTGITSTLTGRIRFIPDINSKNKNIRSMSERIAVNTQIQGTAADILKLAMIKLHSILKEKHMNSKMILSVHDEIVLEVPQDEIMIIQQLVKDTMENIMKLKTPLKVNIEIGKNWADAH